MSRIKERFLLDTNIYGELLLDKDFELLMEKMMNQCVVHGFKVIRNELRAVPTKIKVENKNLRIGLLHIYDELIKQSYTSTKEIVNLAEDYYVLYRKLGGSKGSEEMRNDLLIVACASVNQVDIVVSEDCKSMLSENAIKAYEFVNLIRKKRTPNFIGYLKLKRLLI